MPKKISKEEHNSECFWCGSTYLLRQTEENNIGRVGDFGPRTCGTCGKAKVYLNDDRANKYYYYSLKEIKATWEEVKTDAIADAALRHFAESLPVEKETQEALIERLRRNQQ